MYRVMLADDEPIMRKALQSLIKWEDLDCQVVYTAANGNDVMEHLGEMAPDILVTDIQMPGKDGIALAEYIWENKLPVKVIILTAFADFSYAQSAIKYNVVEYVTKTGAFEGLIQAVENCKALLKEARAAEDPEARKAKEENFFKGVFDGSIYEDIPKRSRALGLELDTYRVLLFQFLLEKGLDQKRSLRIQDGLCNFFAMAFGKDLIQGVFLRKDLYCAVVRCTGTHTEEWLKITCAEIMDMTDNFMELYSYIGTSGLQTEIEMLPEAYAQASAALKHSACEDSEKMVFYTEKLDEETMDAVNPDTREALVKACLSYREEHYQEGITVSDIARAVGTSASYLSRVFKEITGATVIQSMNQKRLGKAKNYLDTTDMKIYEIADALGFENITYFSRFFKKHTGMSPKEYKECH